MKKFCERLRDTRKKLGLTGTEVAETVGLSRNYIYELERARKTPSLETVIKLSDVYRDPSLVDQFMSVSTKMNNVDGNFYDAGKLASIRIQLDEIMKSNPEAYKEAMEYLQYFLTKYGKNPPNR